MIVQMLGKSNGCLGTAHYRYAQYMPSGLGASIINPNTGKPMEVTQEEYNKLMSEELSESQYRALAASIAKKKDKFSVTDWGLIQEAFQSARQGVVDIAETIATVRNKLSPKGKKELDDTVDQTFGQKYGAYLVGGGVLLAVLIIVLATKKRRRR